MNFSDVLGSKKIEFTQINKYVRECPEDFVTAVEADFKKKVTSVADIIFKIRKDCKFVMLCGPSSSGKTTTAKLLRKEFQSLGIGAVYLSLDDFYNDFDKAPLLPNGQRDVETINALNMQAMDKCLKDLMLYNECEKPIFDFMERKVSDKTVNLKVDSKQIIILEGLHALNPILTNHLPQNKIAKIYIEADSMVKYGDRVLMSAYEIRLLRRLVRDSIYRSADANLTLSMWDNVCEGERKYIRPYRNSVSFVINSFHAYEPCILKDRAIQLLSSKSLTEPYKQRTNTLKDFLAYFETLSEKYVPEDSLMREFIGFSEI